MNISYLAHDGNVQDFYYHSNVSFNLVALVSCRVLLIYNKHVIIFAFYAFTLSNAILITCTLCNPVKEHNDINENI